MSKTEHLTGRNWLLVVPAKDATNLGDPANQSVPQLFVVPCIPCIPWGRAPHPAAAVVQSSQLLPLWPWRQGFSFESRTSPWWCWCLEVLHEQTCPFLMVNTCYDCYDMKLLCMIQTSKNLGAKTACKSSFRSRNSCRPLGWTRWNMKQEKNLTLVTLKMSRPWFPRRGTGGTTPFCEGRASVI